MTRILIVEDSATQATLLAALLEEAGFETITARGGEEALDAVRADGSRFALVLSDIIMPGLSGYEVCRRIKEDLGRRDLPVVLLTGLSDPLDIIRGLECGADNYITKPYVPEHLVQRVRQVIANRELRDRMRPDGGVEIAFMGERFVITAGKEQILDLLMSSYEELVRTNQALEARTHEAEHAREEAETANRAKSDFLAMMSHELRTPLNAISGYTQLLEDGVEGPVTEAQLRSLRRVRRNQEHLLALINDVLNFAKLETGRVEMRRDEIPVDEMLSTVDELVRPQVTARQLGYEYRPGAPNVTLVGDRERVLQVILNLLTNAVKFTDAGGRIILAWDATPDTVTVRVRDTGIGIPEDKLKAIFDPFVQVEQRTRSRDGVGLGLAISRDLAQAMGGSLAATSTLGEGSTFTLVLPRGVDRRKQ
ncbi:MAG: hybrid sensor histidine kinase/response regulator [Gemmatimonadaceae bacterium]